MIACTLKKLAAILNPPFWIFEKRFYFRNESALAYYPIKFCENPTRFKKFQSPFCVSHFVFFFNNLKFWFTDGINIYSLSFKLIKLILQKWVRHFVSTILFFKNFPSDLKSATPKTPLCPIFTNLEPLLHIYLIFLRLGPIVHWLNSSFKQSYWERRINVHS